VAFFVICLTPTPLPEERGCNPKAVGFSPLLSREKGTEDEAGERFPTLLTIVDNFCLYQVYNKSRKYIVF
jgi:hypothetical protein